MRFILAVALVAACSVPADAKCGGLFKGRLRHAAHRAVDAPFKAAAGVKAVVKGPAKAAPCVDGKCAVPAVPAKK